MSEFNFKPAICTSIEQSERLLALGLKKDTADMVYTYEREEHEDNYYWKLEVLESPWDSYVWSSNDTFIPAWSLGRLIELMPRTAIMHTQEGDARIDIDIYAIEILVSDDSIAGAVSVIEWLIKEGYFNKEYLV